MIRKHAKEIKIEIERDKYTGEQKSIYVKKKLYPKQNRRSGEQKGTECEIKQFSRYGLSE